MEEIKYIGKCLLIEEKNKESVLVIGDLHLGYEAGLGISGLDLGEKRFVESLGEMEEIFKEIGKEKVGKIILLGDLKHDFSGLNNDEQGKITKLLDYLTGKCEEIVIIRGNHDNYLLNLTKKKGLKTERSYKLRENFFIHGDEEVKGMWGEDVKRVIMGHLHPSIKLKGGVKSEVYKCFLEGEHKGKEIIVLPSFAEIGKGLDVREMENSGQWKFNWKKFYVKVIGEGGVLDFGKIEELGD